MQVAGNSVEEEEKEEEEGKSLEGCILSWGLWAGLEWRVVADEKGRMVADFAIMAREELRPSFKPEFNPNPKTRIGARVWRKQRNKNEKIEMICQIL